MDKDPAVCRGCGMLLRGDDYRYGGWAYHPDTNEQCKVNHYGGFICSSECDRRASLVLERTMPGHDGSQSNLGCHSRRSYNRNWEANHDH